MTVHTGNIPGTIQSLEGGHRAAWLNTAPTFNRVSAGFTSNGMLHAAKTSHQPGTIENRNVRSGHRMSAFSDDFFNRVLIEPESIDVGSIASDQIRHVSVFNAYFHSVTLSALAVTDSSGITLTGPAQGSVWSQLQTVVYRIDISSEGSSIINSGVLFNWTGAQTKDNQIIPIIGNRVVFLPYQAITPWKESYTWWTEIIESNDGTEQRIRKRKHPRQEIEASYPVSQAQGPRATNLINGARDRIKWVAAMWSDAQNYGALASGSLTLFGDWSHYDYRIGAMALIWENDILNEIVYVSNIAGNVLTLNHKTVYSYSNAIIMPARICRLIGNPSRKTNGYNSVISVKYNTVDNLELSNSASPYQFEGYDLYWNPLFTDGSGNVGESATVRVDNDDFGGVQTIFFPWKNVKIARTYSFFYTNPTDIWAFKQFLNRRNGMQRPFWYPTFERDMILNQLGNVSTELHVRDPGYRGIADRRLHIGIQFQDGTWTARKISNVIAGPNGTNVVNFLGTALNVDASFIKNISYLSLQRLASDKVDLEYSEGGICSGTLNLIEVSQ